MIYNSEISPVYMLVRSTGVYAASGQRVSSGEPRHSVLPDATRHGPHPLCGARRPARARRAHARGLNRKQKYLNWLKSWVLSSWEVFEG